MGKCLWCGVAVKRHGRWDAEVCDKCAAVNKKYKANIIEDTIGYHAYMRREVGDDYAHVSEYRRNQIIHAVEYNDYELTLSDLMERFDLSDVAILSAIGPERWKKMKKQKLSWESFVRKLDDAVIRHGLGRVVATRAGVHVE